jgi:hypothetical protein
MDTLLTAYLVIIGAVLAVLFFVGLFIVVKSIFDHKGSVVGDMSFVASRNRFNQGNIRVMAKDIHRTQELATMARNDKMTGRDK